MLSVEVTHSTIRNPAWTRFSASYEVSCTVLCNTVTHTAVRKKHALGLSALGRTTEDSEAIKASSTPEARKTWWQHTPKRVAKQ